MPIIKSAKKRVRLARKATLRNSKTKRVVKDAVKQLRAKSSQTALSHAQSALDTAVKKGILSKQKAARKKKQLAAQAKAAGVKVGAKKAKTTAPKASAKKPTAKKSPVKKTTAKKTAKK